MIKNGVIYVVLLLLLKEPFDFWEFCVSADVSFKISNIKNEILIASLMESFILFDKFELDSFDLWSAVDFYCPFFLPITSANLKGVSNFFFAFAEEWKLNFLILPMLLSYYFSNDPSVLTVFDLYAFIYYLLIIKSRR